MNLSKVQVTWLQNRITSNFLNHYGITSNDYKWVTTRTNQQYKKLKSLLEDTISEYYKEECLAKGKCTNDSPCTEFGDTSKCPRINDHGEKFRIYDASLTNLMSSRKGESLNIDDDFLATIVLFLRIAKVPSDRELQISNENLLASSSNLEPVNPENASTRSIKTLEMLKRPLYRILIFLFFTGIIIIGLFFSPSILKSHLTSGKYVVYKFYQNINEGLLAEDSIISRRYFKSAYEAIHEEDRVETLDKFISGYNNSNFHNNVKIKKIGKGVFIAYCTVKEEFPINPFYAHTLADGQTIKDLPHRDSISVDIIKRLRKFYSFSKTTETLLTNHIKIKKTRTLISQNFMAQLIHEYDSLLTWNGLEIPDVPVHRVTKFEVRKGMITDIVTLFSNTKM